MSRTTQPDFVAFFRSNEPRLRQALVALRGPEDGRDATAEALTWAWENWHRLRDMENPVGYLYRVGHSRSRPPRPPIGPNWPGPSAASSPQNDDELEAALARLPIGQRTAVVLVHGCDWSYDETAAAMGISKSSVGTHLRRGLAKLRRELEERR